MQAVDDRALGGFDDVAAAIRRAAIVQHHRAVTADLAVSPDRDAIRAAFEGVEQPASVVVVVPGGVEQADRALLDQISTRLRSIVRESDCVHRLGGRFVMVLPGDRYLADRVANRVAAAFTAPFSVAGTDVTVEPAVGIADADPADPTAAMQRAELAARRIPSGRPR